MNKHYTSSFDSTNTGKLTDKNHFSQAPKDFLNKVFPTLSFGTDRIGEKFGIEHTITKWADSKFIENNEFGEPLDIIILSEYGPNYKDVYWIPSIELIMLEEQVNRFPKVRNLTWGYIDGRAHHLGQVGLGSPSNSKYPGYTMFIECAEERDYTNEEFDKLVDNFQEEVNKRAEEIQNLRPDLHIVNIDSTCPRYDFNKKGLIQMVTIGISPEFNPKLFPAWHSKR